MVYSLFFNDFNGVHELTSFGFSIFVKSKRASLRVKDKVTNFVESKLHLTINEQKSQICRPIQYFILGYGFVPTYKKGEKGKYGLRVGPKSFKRLKQKIKEVIRKTLPLPFTVRLYKLEPITRGWVNYFRFANIVGKLKSLDAWVRNRLRYCIWNRALFLERNLNSNVAFDFESPKENH